ncbi:ATP-binding protein [Mucilaginibacter sp.]|uniref:sensor histidine kinase n=1 Tax=Mucilaginibacter sp. TaxID=1882438 RepID=UPI0025FC1E3B|nr:ATP-binding protein [Mucilaginibacter sp.]
MSKEIRYKANKQHILNDYMLGGNYIGNWKIALSSGKISICPRMRKILELQKGDYEGLEDLLTQVKSSHAGKLIHEFKLACFNGTRFEKQIHIVTQFGNEKWIQLSGILYSRRWGAPEQMVGTIEDVTQKVKEDCLSMAIVNHELRSPLTLIKLNTQFLINELSHCVNKRPVRLLNMVDDHVDGMTKLIDEYLTTSTDDEREPRFNLTVFDLDNLVNTVINEVKLLYPGHRFRKVPAEATILVRADKYKIIRVLINYLTNAAKFSPACSNIIISVTKAPSEITVSVQDEGPGIDEEKGQLVFQKFYQCDSQSTRQKNSKGLGLYIVKNIIQKHGGAVWAENGPVAGAVFYFSLPVFQEITLNCPVQEAVKLTA